jgi:hypothetical protein
LHFPAVAQKTVHIARLSGKRMKTSTSPKRATWLADREIAHLEIMLGGMREGIEALSRLTASYWHARISNIEAEFLLVATQRQRVLSLRRALEALVLPESSARRQSEQRTSFAA